MSITTNASRIRVESAAKNGTLSTQGAIGNKQIKLDTSIATNNSNLVASPTLVGRAIILRDGGPNRQTNIITTVDGDGVTCTCEQKWRGDNNPASGETYQVAYVGDDIATIAGCSINSTEKRFDFTKRLVIGDGINFAFVSIINDQHFYMSDEGAANALNVSAEGQLQVGSKGSKGTELSEGGIITFTHDTTDEVAFRIQNDGKARFYKFVLKALHAPDGVVLASIIGATASVRWGSGVLIGVDGPLKSRRNNFRNVEAVDLGTVGDLKADAASLSGWCDGDMDMSVNDAIAGEDDDAKVYIIVEDADS